MKKSLAKLALAGLFSVAALAGAGCSKATGDGASAPKKTYDVTCYSAAGQEIFREPKASGTHYFDSGTKIERVDGSYALVGSAAPCVAKPNGFQAP